MKLAKKEPPDKDVLHHGSKEEMTQEKKLLYGISIIGGSFFDGVSFFAESTIATTAA